MKKNAFTLSEILVVVALLLILIVITVGILNPVVLVGRANDAKRKSDLDKLKDKLEEYYSDKGRYPVSGSWSNDCGRPITDNDIGNYIGYWPCDPDGSNSYHYISDDGSSYRILTNLQNKDDNGVPYGWYSLEDVGLPEGYTADNVNYGVSSSNISWYSRFYDDACNFDPATFMTSNNCYQDSVDGCKGPMKQCSGPNCYTVSDCDNNPVNCQVQRCCADSVNGCSW